MVGAQRVAVRKAHAVELAAARRCSRLDRDLAVLPARGEHRIEHRGAGDAGAEIAAVPLEDGPPDPLAIDLGIAAGRLGTRQLLEHDPRLLEERERRALVRIVVLHEPQHADRVVQPAPPAALMRLPQCEGAHRQVRVDRAGAVRRANDARLTARAGARVSRPPGVEQRDAGAAAQQPERRPATEGPRPYHHHVRSLFGHRNKALEQRQGAERAEERAALHRCPSRTSRTASRTASRAAAPRGGPQGSSHASPGMTPSAASAHSIRWM